MILSGFKMITHVNSKSSKNSFKLALFLLWRFKPHDFTSKVMLIFLFGFFDSIITGVFVAQITGSEVHNIIARATQINLSKEVFLLYLIFAIMSLYILKPIILKYSNNLSMSYRSSMTSFELAEIFSSNLSNFHKTSKSEKENLLLQEVENFVLQIAQPFVTFLTSFTQLIILIGFIVYNFGFISIYAVFILGIPLILVGLVSRKPIHEYGKQRIQASEARFLRLSNILAAHEKIFLRGSVANAISNLDTNLQQINSASANINVIQLFPRITIEALIFLTVGFAFLISSENGISSQIIFIGMISLKIIPGIQSAYLLGAKCAFNKVLLTRIYSHDVKKINETSRFSFDEIRTDRCQFTVGGAQFTFPSCTFQVGRIYMIKGASGSGKTTFIRYLSGLWGGYKRPKYFKLGKQIYHEHYKLPAIAYLSQNELVLDENIEDFRARISKYVDVSLFNRLLQVMELPLNTKLVNWSGGERQRLLLAEVIAEDSSAIFLDEATSALDTQLQLKVVEILRKTRKLIIWINHRPELFDFADEVITFDK